MPKKIPMRQCLGCREMRAKRELIRVVKSRRNEISLDFKGRNPDGGLSLSGQRLSGPGPQVQGAGAGLFHPDPGWGLCRPGGADAGRGKRMNSVLHLIGLARKAGRLAVGEDPVGEAVKSREGKLLLVACDAAENTIRRAGHMAERHRALPHRPLHQGGLGHTVGRSSCALLAFTDVGLACAAAEKLAAEDPGNMGAAASCCVPGPAGRWSSRRSGVPGKGTPGGPQQALGRAAQKKEGSAAGKKSRRDPAPREPPAAMRHKRGMRTYQATTGLVPIQKA